MLTGAMTHCVAAGAAAAAAAAAAAGGGDLEKQLLSDVGARGTESSCKSLFVAALLDELVAGGHRTLVFSQSRVMLDILQV
jgi:SNF2 family DNA or RNA helicase